MDIKESKELSFDTQDFPKEVWVFDADNLDQGTEISHLMMSHAEEYTKDELSVICRKASMVIDQLRTDLAKAQAAPEGFVLVSKDNLSVFWQDSDEPENFCSSESDFDDLGDCIELGDIMEINKHTRAHIQTEKLFGTWFAEAIDPSEKANFFVGTHEECMAIVEKNKAMIEAQEPAND